MHYGTARSENPKGFEYYIGIGVSYLSHPFNRQLLCRDHPGFAGGKFQISEVFG